MRRLAAIATAVLGGVLTACGGSASSGPTAPEPSAITWVDLSYFDSLVGTQWTGTGAVAAIPGIPGSGRSMSVGGPLTFTASSGCITGDGLVSEGASMRGLRLYSDFGCPGIARRVEGPGIAGGGYWKSFRMSSDRRRLRIDFEAGLFEQDSAGAYVELEIFGTATPGAPRSRTAPTAGWRHLDGFAELQQSTWSGRLVFEPGTSLTGPCGEYVVPVPALRFENYGPGGGEGLTIAGNGLPGRVFPQTDPNLNPRDRRLIETPLQHFKWEQAEISDDGRSIRVSWPYHGTITRSCPMPTAGRLELSR